MIKSEIVETNVLSETLNFLPGELKAWIVQRFLKKYICCSNMLKDVA